MRTEAVPDQDLEWNNHTPGGNLARHQFVTCLLASLPKTTLKAVNYEKIQEGIQDKHEKTSQFLDSLTKPLSQYTGLDLETPDRNNCLGSTSFPRVSLILEANLNIWRKDP